MAPFAGALVGASFQPSAHVFGIGLGVFAGIFIMIGAGELLPEAHSEPSAARLALTAAGVALMFAVTRVASL